MSVPQTRAPPSAEERQEERTTSDAKCKPRPSDQAATFTPQELWQLREYARNEDEWNRAAAAAGVPRATTAYINYHYLQRRMGSHSPQDAQFNDPTDRRNLTAEVTTKATTKEEDSDTEGSEGGIKINIQKEAESDNSDDSDGGVRLNVLKQPKALPARTGSAHKKLELPAKHTVSGPQRATSLQ